ncbi:MAG TPA: caspase family protein [Actinophytocola sp.]|uniref:caspase family protein n=1 Tax=Actinophytocola sp. TaxID=1872138 RepID=UPI002DDCEAF4|nr:caspase family protein [Actinophytocola sp.]HEV2782347.1 caspase family protein [Actinophytocola sp.]
MAGKRTALLIATDTYADTAFRQLRAPRRDAGELAEVLRDERIGDYRVDMLVNRRAEEVRIRLNELFGGAGRDDLILVYVSGHGIKDETGRLHFATTDSRRNLLAATAVSARFVRELIDESAARRVVVWLDCCYAGAFPAGRIPKAETAVDVLPQLSPESGRGCAVMTASTHIQFAFESGVGATVSAAVEPSVFTSAIIEGLRTGDADLNADGLIDADELYHYVHDRVRAHTPGQTPTRNNQVTGQLYIARSNRARSRPPDQLIEFPSGPRNVPEPPAMVASLAEHGPRLPPHPRATAPHVAPPMPVPPELHRVARWSGPAHFRPSSVNNAFRLLLAAVAISVIWFVLDLFVYSDEVAQQARNGLRETNQSFTEQDVERVVVLSWVITAVLVVLLAGLVILLAYKLRAGRNWARILLVVLGVLLIAMTLITIGQASTVRLVFSLAQAVLVIAAVCLSVTPTANRYLAATRARR